jgi:hypothetical protein
VLVPAEPPCRGLRASLAAGAAVTLGVIGHAVGGGDPTAAGMVLSFAAMVGPSWLLAGRERGLLTIVALQVAAQQVVHPLLTLGGGPTVSAVPHDVMFLAHLLGALVMAVWLSAGERRAWAAARRAVERLTLLCLPLPVPRPRRPAAAPIEQPPARCPRRRLLRYEVVRRGPPSLA